MFDLIAGPFLGMGTDVDDVVHKVRTHTHTHTRTVMTKLRHIRFVTVSKKTAILSISSLILISD